MNYITTWYEMAQHAIAAESHHDINIDLTQSLLIFP